MGAADLEGTLTISLEEDPTSHQCPLSRNSSTSPAASLKGMGRKILALAAARRSRVGTGCADAPREEGHSDEAAAAADPSVRDLPMTRSEGIRTSEAVKKKTSKVDLTRSTHHRTRASGPPEASLGDRRTIPRSLEGSRPTCGRTPTRAEGAVEGRLGAGVGSLPPGSGSRLRSGALPMTGGRTGMDPLRRSAGGPVPEATT